MTKKIMLTISIVAVIVLMACMFVACDTGTYTYTAPITGSVSTIKLGMGGKATLDLNVAGISYKGEATYKIDKADEDGNKLVSITWVDEDNKQTDSLPAAYINKDGALVVGLITFTK